MDVHAPLESMARSLPVLPLDAIESLLVTFDTLISLGGGEARPYAAQLLRQAGAQCADPACAERLRRAADAVAAGEPCALAPEGLTGREAAAANTITLEQWQAKGGDPETPESEEEEETEERESGAAAVESMTEPHLPVRHFFAGLVFRLGCDLRDTHGSVAREGSILHLLRCERAEEGYKLLCQERNLPVKEARLVENQGNRWFQPVPTIGCLEDLWETVNDRILAAGFDDDDPRTEFLDDVVYDVGQCEEWIFDDARTYPGPDCTSEPFAAEVFGRDSDVAVWVKLLFAAVRRATDPEV